MKVLVIRADRLGDVILSTPVIAALAPHEVTFLVAPAVAPVLQGLVGAAGGLHALWTTGARGSALVAKIRGGGFDAAIFLQADARLAAAVYAAGVPRRIGPRAKLYSYFFFNEGIRQHRSRVERHEAEYNLELAARFLRSRLSTVGAATQVSVSSRARQEAIQWLRSQGLQAGEKLIAIHPGMGGSALNWPENSYRELVIALARESGFRVLLTGGPTEGELLDRLGQKAVLRYGGAESRDLEFLGGLFSHASLVIAPSTGPLHLAYALGRPVLSFYPPVRVQSVRRWGPFGPGSAHVFTPEAVPVSPVQCPAVYRCLGSACQFYPCMERIPVSLALDQVKKMLSPSS